VKCLCMGQLICIDGSVGMDGEDITLEILLLHGKALETG